MRRINVGSITRWITSSSIFSADLRYCLELSTSSIASFKPGSIALRSLSIFVVPSGSRVVDLRLIAEFPALFLGLRHVAGIPALSVDLRRVAGFPALSISLRYVAGNTRAFWISRAFCRSTPRRWNTRGCWIPALLSTCVSLQSSRAFFDLRDQASISRVYDLPRLSPWSYINIESLDWSYRFPDRSCIGCLRESIWIKLISGAEEVNSDKSQVKHLFYLIERTFKSKAHSLLFMFIHCIIVTELQLKHLIIIALNQHHVCSFTRW